MKFTRVLVAVDFTGITGHVIEAAVEVAKCHSARIDLLYVVEPYEFPIIATVDGVMVPPEDLTVLEEVNERLRNEAKKQIEKYAKKLAEEGIDVESHVLEGEPFEVILDFAEENGSNLIIVGAHGKSGLKRLLIGSVSEKVVRKAKVPVLVVRESHEE